MKNKNGFTLVELLGVIAILAILATIATPIVLTVQKNSKNKMYEAKVKMIKAAADSYAFKNKPTSTTTITVGNLCPNFLSVDEKSAEGGCQINPATGDEMKDCKIEIEPSHGRYKITFPVADDANNQDCNPAS